MKKILILEDGKLISNIINNSLEKENYKIFLFEKDMETMGLIKTFYDLIIADLTSIKHEKVELLMQLRKNTFLTIVPFILITSKNGNESNGHYSSFDYYLTRPFTKDELLDLIDRVLSNKISPW